MGAAGNPLDALSKFLPAELGDALAQLGAGEDPHAERLAKSGADLERIADAVEEIRDAVRSLVALAPLLEQIKDHPFVVGLLAGKSAMSVARKKG